ncbi:CHAT domain-containing protein [Mastigocoleus sp. MO_188.B34]|uniref:CHAT domain-containing protein n=1 Tax=Mastigocoleus sp. MO_188.B34 TaxID=3036635 RepID=UPI002627A947|nr:CHAT domain-containing protein [Mastigocoleus sp. MO_188.B34]MDJ0695367.1 CHAT domain-containing protein [Mastigocoleus sp. MO_188.B34]
MSSDKYIECEIIVESYDTVRFRNKDTGAEFSGKLDLAPRCREIARFENLLRANQLKSRKAFEEFGTLLYRCLFNDGVDDAFKNILKDIRESKRTENPNRYRLQLTFRPEVNELAGIPWEFLYYPNSETIKGRFLADEPNLVISRYIPSELERVDLNITGDSLKILVVTSEPEDRDKVLPHLTIETINNLRNNYLVYLEILENKKIEEVQGKINDIKPHIFHYIGHGEFDSQEQVGSIALVDTNKKAEWIDDNTFGEFFRNFKPRLVILQACQGGEVDFTANYAGLAPQLTRNEIPAVIAMQYPVNNVVASLFSEAFYEALAKGESVDAAMQQGRGKIVRDDPSNRDKASHLEFYSNRNFGTPVLYMSARDGRIMPRPKPKKFDIEVLRSSTDKLEEAINILFNSEELKDLIFCLDINYQELNGKTPQAKIKALIDQLKESNELERLIGGIKEFKPDAFTQNK